MPPLHQIASVAADLVAQWARGRIDGTVQWTAADPSGQDDVPVMDLALPGGRLALAVLPLFDVDADAETLQRKGEAEQRLGQLGAGGLAVWVPPGATVPSDDGDRFVSRVLEAAEPLQAGERAQVAFPVTLYLEKRRDEGRYLEAMGGLKQHWARFTNQVFGSFHLDSRAIHRLPEDSDKVTQLIDLIVLTANGIRHAPGGTEIRAEDTWTVQRLQQARDPIVIAAAPDGAPDDAAQVRRAFRAAVQRAGAALAEVEADAKALALLGLFRALEEESATIALRGMNPLTYGALDCICLVADGLVKPMFGPKPGTLLRPQA